MIVRYEVSFYNNLEHDICNESGVVGITGTIGEAVDRICEHYGKEDVGSIKVTEYEDILCDCEINEMLSTSI